MSGAALAEAAAALEDCRFRLHGRDPATGLDCIGLFGAAMAAIGRPLDLPRTYGLRAVSPAPWLPEPGAIGFHPVSGEIRPGDALMLRLGPVQHHLLIAAAQGGFVHADAGLRRVVIVPCLPEGVVLHHWRLAQDC